MAWDEDFDDDYFFEENDDISLLDGGPGGAFFADRLEEEFDYELYEQERDEADSDDFPDSFEEWKLQKEQERWDEEEEDDVDVDVDMDMEMDVADDVADDSMLLDYDD
jgi:hypothetical protein